MESIVVLKTEHARARLALEVKRVRWLRAGAQYSKGRRGSTLPTPLVDCPSAISLRAGAKMAGLALDVMASLTPSLMPLFSAGV